MAASNYTSTPSLRFGRAGTGRVFRAGDAQSSAWAMRDQMFMHARRHRSPEGVREDVASLDLAFGARNTDESRR